jgi:sulfate transport system substrate-binding protein
MIATVWSILLILAQSSCRQKAGDGKTTIELTLAAYSTPREAYGKEIIPAFQRYWRNKTGEEVVFNESYQGSGAQSRAVIGGFEADIAALSLETDIDRIAEAGLITHDWRKAGKQGMVSNSIVVLAVRTGNPKGIHDWADLTKANLNILTPDPKTSGGAQWNINALYGAALRGFAGTPKDNAAAAQQLLRDVFKNVSIMDKGARESIANFEKGIGDVAITYENEVITSRLSGQQYDYIIPHSTILIENPVALIDKYVDKHGARKQAEAFIEFLTSKEAQQAYAKFGFRPVDESVYQQFRAQFPEVADLWKIDFLGGWKKVSVDIYGPQGVYDKINEGPPSTK